MEKNNALKDFLESLKPNMDPNLTQEEQLQDLNEKKDKLNALTQMALAMTPKNSPKYKEILLSHMISEFLGESTIPPETEGFCESAKVIGEASLYFLCKLNDEFPDIYKEVEESVKKRRDNK